MTPKRVGFGFQGLTGAYHEKAAKEYLKRNKIREKKVELVSCNVFEEIFEKVESGEFEYGIVAVENSLMGSIYKNFDLLQKHNLKIVGEVYVHVKHQVYALPGTKVKDVKELMSQTPAILQCEHNINKYFPGIKITEYFDTVASSKFVSEKNDKSLVAISPEGAGEKFGLVRLKKDFNDDMNNYTRFFIIHKDYITLNGVITDKSQRKYKTSILFYGGNVTGFLYKALGCFSLRDISLSKIESRPIPKSPWNYYFYLDFEGKYNDEKVMNAINNLKEYASEVKVLGSYIAHKI
jgi:prephenate dehydratase